MANGKKLMVVIPTLTGGGAERVATTLLHSLPRTVPGIEQVVVLFGSETSVPLPTGTRVRLLNLPLGGTLFAAAVRTFKIIFRLAAILREERPDTVLSFMDYTNIVAIVANWLAGMKSRLVISVRTRPSAQAKIYAANNRVRVVDFMIRWLYNRADAVIAVSRDVADDLKKNFHVARRLVEVINNPVDAAKIAQRGGEEVLEPTFDGRYPVVLTVGRLSKEKGHVHLLRAFALIVEQTSARLVLVGEGAEEKNLRLVAKDLGITERVFFLGYRSNPYKYMKRSTIFVLSSFYEGFVNVVVEAMACGLPVVATHASADIGDVVADGVSGLLVPVGDEEALAQAMLRLLDDPVLRSSMSDEAPRRLEGYSLEKITASYAEILGLRPGLPDLLQEAGHDEDEKYFNNFPR